MTTQPIDLLWIVLCAALVFLMQAGCLCLESGLTRNKNSINVAAENVADFAIAAFGFWLVGFGLMFGPTWGGWLGAGLFGLLDQIPSRPGLLAFVLFQLMFCATATTIVAGAVAERMRFGAYLAISTLVSVLVYPVFGHWAWGGAPGASASPAGWRGWASSTSPARPWYTASAAGWRWWPCCTPARARALSQGRGAHGDTGRQPADRPCWACCCWPLAGSASTAAARWPSTAACRAC